MNDADFRFLIVTALKTRTDRELAQLLRLSVPTIRRWSEGRNLAHPALRDGVRRALAE